VFFGESHWAELLLDGGFDGKGVHISDCRERYGISAFLSRNFDSYDIFGLTGY
jgi:hypothetical protein